ncbi:hypothetical protein [Agrobacterium sp.]|uniref:hypothetical protein n=1 Tax=Agrobacterium sp. TaxID=361 RepID=UPI0028B1BA93|nr:hypothetical protein [Agrobacterium sp.]
MVVGAGASIAQAIDSEVEREFWPPSMLNFARKTWEKSPYPFLYLFLKAKGLLPSDDIDLREVFYNLEANQKTNIEDFMEFAWKISDQLPLIEGSLTYWDNMMIHSIGDPIALLIDQGFHRNGTGFIDLKLTKEVLSKFGPTDFVLNLNYDTLVEIALSQSDRAFTYLPNTAPEGSLPVCKPHGSLNMAFTHNSFAFGDPTNLWPLFTTGDERRAYIGLMPPRSNKSYAQMPMAKMMLDGVSDRKPESIVMWGIGLTGSDVDLNDIYKAWSESASFVDVINPDSSVAAKVQEAIGIETRSYASAQKWLETQ